MKKLLTILSLIIFPSIAYATIATGWNTPAIGTGYIQPTAINGVQQAVRATYFTATSTTVSSFINASTTNLTALTNLTIGATTAPGTERINTGYDSGTGDKWYYLFTNDNGYNPAIQFHGHGSFGGDSVLGAFTFYNDDWTGDARAGFMDNLRVSGNTYSRWTTANSAGGGFGKTAMLSQNGLKITSLNDWTLPTSALDVNGDITDENVKSASCIGTDSTGKIISASCAGSGGVTPTGGANAVQTDNGSGGLYGDSNLTWDGSTLTDNGAVHSAYNTLDDGSGNTTITGILNSTSNLTLSYIGECDGPSSALGTDASGNVYCDTSISDERLKTDFATITPATALAGIMSLTPITYHYTDAFATSTQGKDEGLSTSTEMIGFKAQDVQKVFPDVVSTTTIRLTATTTEKVLTVDYQHLSVEAFAAIQGLQKEIDTLNARLTSAGIH